MTVKTLMAAGIACLLGSSTALAQVQSPLGGGATPYVPNYYNRNNQPLSPYLNLARGGNPAVNYFYGVRPGLMTGAFGPATSNMPASNSATYRQSFFNQIDTLYELDEAFPSGGGLRPTGHPFGFNNTMGYFGGGGMGGQRNANQAPIANRRSTMSGR